MRKNLKNVCQKSVRKPKVAFLILKWRIEN